MTDMLDVLDRAAVTTKQTRLTSRKVKIVITAMPLQGPPWVDFAMRSRYPDHGGEQQGDELKFNAHAGPFKMMFRLEDETDLDLKFYPDFADAMWVVAGPDCPKAAGNGNGAITEVDVDDDELVAMNSNVAGQTLTFALRFTGRIQDKDHPPYVFDPKIINGGDGLVSAKPAIVEGQPADAARGGAEHRDEGAKRDSSDEVERPDE